MAKRSPKCPPTVESNQIGCVWNFSGMFDHHHRHGGSHRKLPSNEIHRRNNVSGAGHKRNQVPMLTFDEQLRSINPESKKKTASSNQLNHKRENNEVRKNTMEKSFWKKMTSRHENPNKKKENTNIVDKIVVLKPPRQRLVESPVDIGCRCSHFNSHQSSRNKQQVIKHTHMSFNDVRKKLKNAKKLKSIEKIKSFGEIDSKASKLGKSSLASFSKKKEPEIFVEARRQLAERLRLVAQGAGLGEPLGSPSKRVSRTLERVLLSSPKHESMTSFGHEPKETRGAKSFQKTWSGSSLQNGSSGNGSIEGSQLELLLDVSSPKADCKLNENDQFRENPSPVSVLDSFFSDNICSPTSTIESVELQIQPHHLTFEENISQTSSPPHKTSLSSIADDRRFICSYVSDIYQLSQSNWESFLATEYTMESSCDHNKLLYDCVKEVLVSLHSRVTFIGSKYQCFPLEKDVVKEVIERVDWHNGQPAGPRTLDHLVKRDIAKSGKWVDCLSDKDDVVFEVVDETLQDLIMEAIQAIYV